VTVRHALGLDIGDSALIALVVDEEGRVVSRQARDAATTEAAAALMAALPPRLIAAVGAAVGGAHVAAPSIVSACAAAASVREPARVVTCGSAVALAEHWRGAARDRDVVAALVIGDSVEAGLAVRGVPFEGAHGRAGAAAWLALNPVEREDYRRTGCLDAEVGAGGIVKRIVWRIKAGDRSRVQDMAGGDLGAITVPQVFAAARDGDGVAISVVRDTARYVGMAVANIVTLLDPDVVIVAGLIADAADLLLEATRTEALRRLSPAAGETLAIAAGTLGADAAALGAARAAMLAR
jgi:glucokinase